MSSSTSPIHAVRHCLLCHAVAMIAGCRFHPGYSNAGDAGRGDDAVRDDGLQDDSAQPYCDPTNATLVACYEFESSVTDGTPHHLDPNVKRNVTFGPGKLGTALVVGPTTEVDVPDSAQFDVTALTIEAWINPLQIPPTGTRAGILDCDGRYGLFLTAGATVQCIAGGTAMAGPIVPNQWTHVACTNDGVMVRIELASSGAASLVYSLESRVELGAQLTKLA